MNDKKIINDSGIEIENIYFDNVKENLSLSGDFPFTRGIHEKMYREKLWTMRQYSGFGNAKESNKRFKYLLENGTTGLSVAFDLPTQMGYDSDDKFSDGEVGKVGVAIDSLRDMEKLFDGIELEKVSTSMTINSTASIILAMYIAVAKKQNANLKNLSGTIQNDILKEYIARGTYIYSPKNSMRLINDTFIFCNENLPKWNPISISGYHIREAGSNAVQEIAFTLANAKEYLKSAISAGLDVNTFAPRISFFFNVHNNLFEEVAKFRSARTIWAKIIKNDFHASNQNAMKLRFHVQTGGSTLTAQQIDNNTVRTTIQALAAILGGCQSLHVNSRDEALALPTEESVRLSLRTQQIIAFESGVTETVDPIGGSFYVENLTLEMTKKIEEYLNKIDSIGGSVKAIEKHFFQDEIERSAYLYQKNIDEKNKIIVGVNSFKSDDENRENIFTINPQIEIDQKNEILKIKNERDNLRVEKSLNKISDAANGNENLFPLILDAVEAYATIGEISNTLRNVWGEYQN